MHTTSGGQGRKIKMCCLPVGIRVECKNPLSKSCQPDETCTRNSTNQAARNLIAEIGRSLKEPGARERERERERDKTFTQPPSIRVKRRPS